MSSPAISIESSSEHLFLSNLPLIEEIIATQVRHHALDETDAEDYGSWVKERLIARDFAVLRKFGGRSTLKTYLAVVLTNLFRDYRNSIWGRWRSSAAAKRLGATAIRLEELLHRDGHPLREAVEIMRMSGLELRESDAALLASRLPSRHRGDDVSIDAVAESWSGLATDCDLWAVGADDDVRTIQTLLGSLLQALSPEDGMILRMRYWSDMSVAEIARTLRLKQKPLYRRIEFIQAELRAGLRARGVERALAVDVLYRGLS